MQFAGQSRARVDVEGTDTTELRLLRQPGPHDGLSYQHRLLTVDFCLAHGMRIFAIKHAPLRPPPHAHQQQPLELRARAPHSPQLVEPHEPLDQHREHDARRARERDAPPRRAPVGGQREMAREALAPDAPDGRAQAREVREEDDEAAERDARHDEALLLPLQRPGGEVPHPLPRIAPLAPAPAPAPPEPPRADLRRAREHDERVPERVGAESRRAGRGEGHDERAREVERDARVEVLQAAGEEGEEAREEEAEPGERGLDVDDVREGARGGAEAGSGVSRSVGAPEAAYVEDTTTRLARR